MSGNFVPAWTKNHNLIPMNYREISFLGLAVSLLLIPVIVSVCFAPKKSNPLFEFKSEKSRHLKTSYGDPDKFSEYFVDVEGLNDGYDRYPQGYQMVEFQKSMLANAKRGYNFAQLDWVERGPGRTGGRTRAILIDHADPTVNTWYVGSVGGGVWKAKRETNSIGRNAIKWIALTEDLPSLAVSAMAGASVKFPKIVYVGTGEGFFNVNASSGVGMFKTTDGGNTWIHLSATINNPNWAFINRIIVDPNNPDIIVVATNTRIYRSENGGESFIRVLRKQKGPIQDLRAKPDDFNVQFASVRGSGILKSIDAGKTWNSSLSELAYEGGRIELAISLSHPEVIWASVEGSYRRTVDLGQYNAPIAYLYRSVDSGDTWRFVDHLSSVSPFGQAFLSRQGWYDNTIVVHPFSPDTVFLGGVFRFKAWIEGSVKGRGTIKRLQNNVSHLNLINFGGSHAGGKITLGTFEPQASNIADTELTSVEIRFGKNRTQFAHRYTVPATGGSNRDGGAGIAFKDYIYRDYVEVPFQVFDKTTGQQLMVSFRDQGYDGTWNLKTYFSAGPGRLHSREYILVSKYDYNAEAPLPDYTVNGGFANGLMYFIWPTRTVDDDILIYPDGLLEGTLKIDYVLLDGEFRNTQLWENDEVHVDHHNLTILPIDVNNNEFHIVNGNDGGFAYSRDGGNTWIEGDRFPGYNTSQFYDATKQPGVSFYLGGTQDNGTWLSPFNPNARRGWEEVQGGDGFDVVWKSADSLMGSIQGNYITRSIGGPDYGNWNLAGNILDFPGQFLTSLSWTPESEDYVFSISPGRQGGLLRSTNFGRRWQLIQPKNINQWGDPHHGGKVRISIADPEVVWAGYRMRGNGARLHVSENAQNPRQARNNQKPVLLRSVKSPDFVPTAPITGLATHPINRATAYVTFSVSCQPKLVRTEDMGETWQELSGFVGSNNCQSNNGFPNARVWDVEVFPDYPNIIWAGTDMGIFESRDHGETWAYADNGLPAVSVWRIRIVDGEVVVATHGRGVWSLDLDQVQGQIQTSVADVVDNIPISFELLDNYPNPFNPSTTIGFKVLKDSHISVAVFDVLGRKVATLTDQYYARGTHEITWNASAASSGQYIYRMEADGKLISAKSMVLSK